MISKQNSRKTKTFFRCLGQPKCRDRVFFPVVSSRIANSATSGISVAGISARRRNNAINASSGSCGVHDVAMMEMKSEEQRWIVESLCVLWMKLHLLSINDAINQRFVRTRKETLLVEIFFVKRVP